MIVNTNHTFQQTRIFSDDEFEKYREKYQSKYNKIAPKSKVDYVNTGQEYNNDYIEGFGTRIEAKLFIAQQRQLVIADIIFNQSSKLYNEEELSGSIFKEYAKTNDWIDKQKIKYPEYFL